MPHRLAPLLLLALAFALPRAAGATVIALYDFEGQNRHPVVEAPGVDAGFFSAENEIHLVFPTGNAPTPLHGFSVCGFVTGNYFEFSVVPEAGVVMNLSSLSLDHHASSSGPQQFDVLVDSGTGFVALATGVANPLAFAPGPMTTVGRSGLGPPQGPVPVRLVGTHASSALGSFTVDNVELQGSITAIPEPTVALLMGLGLAGLAHAGGRAKRRPRPAA